jgi:hypothetical protein
MNGSNFNDLDQFIDELILGLTGLRQLVSLHGPTPAEAPRRKLHLVKGFLRGFGTKGGVW